jgi:hypothetical protein
MMSVAIAIQGPAGRVATTDLDPELRDAIVSLR